MYSTLSLFKAYLGIDVSDTSQDEILVFYLKSAYEYINKYCGVKTFDLNQFEEIVYLKDNQYSRGYEFYLNNKPIHSLDKIGGEDYTGELGKDYLIVNERKIILEHTISKPTLGYITVVYTAGYNRNNEGTDEIPAGLQLAEMMIACGQKQAKESVGGIQSYKLGDETITFGSRDSSKPDVVYSKVKSILDLYKNFKLNY